MDRATIALTLPAVERRAIVRRAFASPSGERSEYGLGRALVEFVDWQVGSGRLDDIDGSPWWRIVNGAMMLDLQEPTEPWRRFGAVPTQRSLWNAHEASLGEAVALAGASRDLEPPGEAAFIGLVLAVVRYATRAGTPTDTAELGELTARAYPDHYPATSAEVEALAAMLAAGSASTR